MRILKIFIGLLLLLAIAFSGALYYLSLNYGEIVRENLIERLNKNLNSEVKVGDIKVSSWKKIPFFSLEFKDVLILEPKNYAPSPDTLFFLEQVYFQFDLWDIYNGNYNLKEVEIEGGDVRMKVNESGVFNYIFWKESTDTSSTNFQLQLKRISLSNVQYLYDDREVDFSIEAQVDQMNLNGDFDETSFELKYVGNISSVNIIAQGSKVVNDVDLIIVSGIGGNGKTLEFQKGTLKVNESLNFGFSGEVGIEGDGYYHFKVDGQDITLEKAIRQLPKNIRNYLKDYQSTGVVEFDGEFGGEQVNKWKFQSRSEFRLQNGTLKSKDLPSALESIYLKGSFNYGHNYPSGKLILDTISFDLPNGKLSGTVRLHNFTNPTVKYDLSGSADLTRLFELFPSEKIDSISGTVKFDLSGVLAPKGGRGNSQQSEIEYSGFVDFYDVNFKPKGLEFSLSKLNLMLEPKPGFIQVSKANGLIQSSPFYLEGKILNLYAWLKNEKILYVEANAKLNHLKLEKYLFEQKEQPDVTRKNNTPIYIKLNANIDTFSHAKFSATNISTKIKYEPGILVANPLIFDALEGQSVGKLYLVDTDNGGKFKYLGEANHINIQQLFFTFDDFGQTEIRSEHLRGFASAEGKFSASILNGEMVPESIEANARLSIENGEILEYSSLVSSADYLKSNLLLKTIFNEQEIENRLRHIKFNKLENEILISNELIVIPEMTISSNFIQLRAEGTHDFDNNINYRINFDASDLLMKKRDYDTEYGYVMDDGTGRFRVFLKMSGTADDPIFEVDKERKKAYKKVKNKDEEKELKSVLRKEYGFFKKDSTLNEAEEGHDFEIEWEAADTPVSKPKEEKKQARESKKEKRKGLKSLGKPIEHEKVEWDDRDF